MLVALGFLVAALLTLIILPAYRRRTARLTTEAIKRAMPLSEAEIRADKDRLRAEYAISVFRLERKVADSNLAAARQMIDINRRDATISTLEGEVVDLRTSLDEHSNARRVLEQTLTDRLPRVEHRLTEAKKMLLQRDREIAALTQERDKQARALEEATQINTQHRDEIQRLSAALTTRAARNRESVADARFDGEVALRAEIEALRAKSLDQASLISRLQAALSRPGSAAAAGVDTARVAELGDADAARREAEIAKLKRELSEAEVALATLRSSKQDDGAASREAELRSLRAEKRDHLARIASLEAAVAAFEKGSGDVKGAKDSRIALKAKLSSLQAQSDEQAQTIQGLRAEIASANERMARQAAHFRDEMRRLGVGTVQTSGGEPSRRGETSQRRSLTSRIAEPRVSRLAPRTEAPAERSAVTDNAAAAAPMAADQKARGATRLKAVDGGAAKGVNGAAPAAAADVEQPAAATAGLAGVATAAETTQPPSDAGGAPAKRPRLMDRIIGLDKSSA